MIRVMLIDDEEDALDLLEILLGQMGNIQITGRYINPIEAIAALGPSPVDAVFLDIQMPGMKGTEVARVIRSRFPLMPIIFTTAYAEYAVEAFEIQSNDYLLKPFTKERLQNAVARVSHAISESVMHASQPANVAPSISCLGGFQIGLPGSPDKVLTWKTKKEKELCAFLIHHAGKPVNAASIIEAIWPGYDLHKAKTYLYTCLSYLRKSLAEHQIPIHIGKADQGFVAQLDGVMVDVTELEQLLSNTWTSEEMDTRTYDQMKQVYTGEYMGGCDFSWATAKQLDIKASYVRVLRTWFAFFQSQGNDVLAVDCMQNLLSVAPDFEVDGRELIKLHLKMGNRNEAHRVIMQLEHAVKFQLGAELEEETLRLVQETKDKIGWQAR
ncbi:response regulator [Paenibacillus oryzisoli]|uniref:Response regulatory domain-containing protein n=1 Tax=Paenibacillus oryzisoli TaxID=1850517 RepID=A0A198ADX7_9BACL|nr:response regulator [Paenibacillus oryzisoli]OAS19704.1 hypothetical protein A8708_26130 [Paenibacillus oryzisoli]